MSTPVAVAAAFALALGATVVAVMRRARTLRPVAPALRTASLWLPLSLRNTASLSLGRVLFVRATEPVEGVHVSRQQVPGGQDAFVYRRGTLALCDVPALVWFHGGGTVLGSPEADHDFCSRLADQLDVVVINVRYRLAPEHRFPAAHDDCHAALRWVHDDAAALGIDANRIAVAGSSAGGGLAAAVVQRACDEQLPVAFQALIYPMLDDRTPLRPRGPRDRYTWTRQSNRYAWTAYLGRRPTLAPISSFGAPARRADLTALPPTWLGVGDLDLFLDEDLDYARRLQAAGVATEVLVEPGMYHGADVAFADTVPTMAAFRAAFIDALARALHLTHQRRSSS